MVLSQKMLLLRSSWSLYTSLHIPFTIFHTASFIVEAQDENIVPLGPERGAILLEVETATIGYCTVAFYHDRFVMAVIGARSIGVIQPRGNNGGSSTKRLAHEAAR